MVLEFGKSLSLGVTAFWDLASQGLGFDSTMNPEILELCLSFSSGKRPRCSASDLDLSLSFLGNLPVLNVGHRATQMTLDSCSEAGRNWYIDVRGSGLGCLWLV